MSNTQMSNEQATRIPSAGMVDMKLDVVVHPVFDVDRAKRFYLNMGCGLDADCAGGDNRQRSNPGTINLRLGAVRRLACEASECGLLA